MLVINFKAYTDGDWGINSELLNNHVSRYFDNDFYEYTVLDEHIYEFRRTYANDELTDAVNFLCSIRDGLHGRDYEVTTVKEYLNAVIDAINNSINCNSYNVFTDLDTDKTRNKFNYSMDGNTELELYGGFCDVNIKKIKHIEYE